MNKKERVLFHKLATLTNLLLMELDEMEPMAEIGVNLHNSAKQFILTLEPFVEASFDSEEIKNGTYLIDLCKKVDTVIRKNYEQIKT